MKKFLIGLLLGLAILTGCQSKKTETQVQSVGGDELDGKAAATLLVDAMIYQKDIDQMKENFGGAEMLLYPNGKSGASYSETIVSGMLQSTNVTNAEKKTIAEAMDQEVIKKATYEIKETVKTGKEWQVTYVIKGLDFIKGMANATRGALEKMVADPSLATNSAELEKQIVAGFPEKLAEAGTVATTQTVHLKLLQDKGKWSVDSSQQNDLNKLLLAFYVGEADEKVAAEKVQTVMTNLMSEYMEKVMDSSGND